MFYFMTPLSDLLYAHGNRIVHATAFVIPIAEHWLERKIALWSTMSSPVIYDITIAVSERNSDVQVTET